MPKYIVRLSQTVIEEAFVEVEASDPDDAEEQALRRAYSGIPDGVDWQFYEDCDDGIDVVSIEIVE